MGARRVLYSGRHHPPSVLVLAALLLRGGGGSHHLALLAAMVAGAQAPPGCGRGAAAGAEEGEARQSGAKQVGHHIAGAGRQPQP